jgi:ribosomal protein S3
MVTKISFFLKIKMVKIFMTKKSIKIFLLKTIEINFFLMKNIKNNMVIKVHIQTTRISQILKLSLGKAILHMLVKMLH